MLSKASRGARVYPATVGYGSAGDCKAQDSGCHLGLNRAGGGGGGGGDSLRATSIGGAPSNASISVHPHATAAAAAGDIRDRLLDRDVRENTQASAVAIFDFFATN